eukprot:TRINITY_DN272_c0_g1_i2.p1 TRINITY_DN272_c0_g1~~TRINITY_DN272_c0_g1_i2.p1  ORF type:complete len:1000 (+),score=87.50 TRINITY_DN272_c0_g1_i2:133-3132(+)
MMTTRHWRTLCLLFIRTAVYLQVLVVVRGDDMYYNPGFSARETIDEVEVDMDQMLALCIPMLPSDLQQQPVLANFTGSASSSHHERRSNYSATNVGSWTGRGFVPGQGGAKGDAEGQGGNNEEGFRGRFNGGLGGKQWRWKLRLTHLRSAGVGWVDGSWSMEADMLEEFGSSKGEETEMNADASSSDDTPPPSHPNWQSPLQINVRGLVFRSPNLDKSHLGVCLLGCHRQLGCSLRFNLGYNVLVKTGRQTVSMAKRVERTLAWEGEMTLLKEMQGRAPMKSWRIEAWHGQRPWSQVLYDFTMEREMQARCSREARGKGSGSLHHKGGSWLPWGYPASVVQSFSYASMEVDTPSKNTEIVVEQAQETTDPMGIPDRMPNYIECAELSIVCFETSGVHATGRDVSSTEEDLSTAFLPFNTSRRHCHTPFFWLGTQQVHDGEQGEMARNQGRKANEADETGLLAYTLTVPLQQGNYRRLYVINLEGSYDRVTGRLCLVGCRGRALHSDELLFFGGDHSYSAIVPSSVSHWRGRKLAGSLVSVLDSDQSTEDSWHETNESRTLPAKIRQKRGGAVAEQDGLSSGGEAAHEAEEEELDCELEVIVQLPLGVPWPLTLIRAPLRGEIWSLRHPKDSRYFEPLSFADPSFLTNEEQTAVFERTAAKLAGGVMLASLMVACLALQIQHMQRHPSTVARMTLLTPLSLAVGLALCIISGLMEDSFKGLHGLVLWGHYSEYSPSVPPFVQATLLVVGLLASYIVYIMWTARRRKRPQWGAEFASHEVEQKKQHPFGTPLDAEMAYLQDPLREVTQKDGDEGGEVSPNETQNDVASSRDKAGNKVDTGRGPTRPYWNSEQSQWLSAPVFLFLVLFSLATLLQWYPLGYLAQLSAGSPSIDPALAPLESVSFGNSLAVRVYQLATIIGVFGNLLQDVFLFPQLLYVACSTRDNQMGPPSLHPAFSYGLSFIRVLAHSLEPFAIQVTIPLLPFFALYYYLLTDYLTARGCK